MLPIWGPPGRQDTIRRPLCDQRRAVHLLSHSTYEVSEVAPVQTLPRREREPGSPLPRSAATRKK